MTKAKELMVKADETGCATIQSGCFLKSRESIIADQQGWEDGDSAKDEDFTGYPYWITTNDGQDLEAIRDEAELIARFPELKIDVEVSKAASALGRKGRAVNSLAQQDAARANGMKGGRPKKNQAE